MHQRQRGLKGIKEEHDGTPTRVKLAGNGPEMDPDPSLTIKGQDILSYIFIYFIQIYRMHFR